MLILKAHNKREAKRLACRTAAWLIRVRLDDCDPGDDFESDDEYDRYKEALADLMAELVRRGTEERTS